MDVLRDDRKNKSKLITTLGLYTLSFMYRIFSRKFIIKFRKRVYIRTGCIYYKQIKKNLFYYPKYSFIFLYPLNFTQNLPIKSNFVNTIWLQNLTKNHL